MTTASVSTNNKGWASSGGGQCPPGHPSFPALALASAQSPLSHPFRLGGLSRPPSLLHFLLTSSHPTQRQRPDQTSPSDQTITLGLPSHELCRSQTHLVPGMWLLSLPNPEMAQRDSCPLLSVSWGQSHLCHTAPVPSPPTCSSLLGSFHTLGPFTGIPGT